MTDLTFTEEQEIEKCPAGNIPLRSDYSKKSKNTTTHFEKSDCLSCPKNELCPVKPQKKSMVLRVSQKAILAATMVKRFQNRKYVVKTPAKELL